MLLLYWRQVGSDVTGHVEVSDDADVLEVMREVAAGGGPPVDRQIVRFAGAELQRHQVLADAGVCPESTLEVQLVAPAPVAAAVSHGANFYIRRGGRLVTTGANVTMPAGARGAKVSAVSAGAYHFLLLTHPDGRVLQGRLPTRQQFFHGQPPEELESLHCVQISAGRRHSVVLVSDGSVRCWGGNQYGQSTTPAAAAQGVDSVSAGGMHTLAVMRDGSVIAWGCNRDGQCDVPDLGAPVRAVSAGFNTSAAIAADGSVAVWGCQSHIKLTGSCRGPFVRVSCGYRHLHGLTEEGELFTWGSAVTPTEAGGKAVAVVAGYGMSVVVYEDGSSSCFGDFGDPLAITSGGRKRNASVPQDVMVDAREIDGELSAAAAR
eukprot:TRINITY_DN2220_c0_g1_i4.p1 TRINITY_DN2220_c0_g1~~TRINITY_DN2220_c0_g1_i4.p1  ORF type:complete len:376 (+),score=86.90 TRINITY_DN2220_c0_g1_i4:88-1215(+)